MLVSVSIFMKGDDLIPSQISAILGVKPTEAHRRGDIWMSPRGKTYTRSTGVWVWGTKQDSESATVAHGIQRLWQEFHSTAECINSLPGVEMCWVDIFVCDVSSSISTEVKFALTPDTLQKLYEIGLPVELTIGTVESE